jgi:hypothetical protein
VAHRVLYFIAQDSQTSLETEAVCSKPLKWFVHNDQQNVWKKTQRTEDLLSLCCKQHAAFGELSRKAA